MHKLLAAGTAFGIASLILLIIKVTVNSGIAWIWVFAPLWILALIVAIPWVVTVSLLWVHEKWGD
jgi:hypothetical protein